MAREPGFAVGAVILSTVLCGCGKSPSAPSGPGTQATVIAETVGTVTVSALFNGEAQAGIGSAAASGSGSVQGASGQVYGTSTCPSGGRVDLVYVRDYTPVNGAIDTAAIKAVYVQCSLSSSGSSVQINGELTMSGMYQGLAQPVDVRLSGALNTSAGECAVDGSIVVTGAFNGTACGIPTRTTPQPRSPAALAAVGNYSLSLLGGSTLPRVVVTRPCIGSMDRGGLALKGDGTYEITMSGSFVCANGPGPNVSYAEPGSWTLVGDRTLVLSAASTKLFAASPATIGGSSISLQLDVPSSAPDIPPTRMDATFTR